MPRFQKYGMPFQYYKPYNYRPPVPLVHQGINKAPPPSPPKPQKSPDPVWLDLFGIKLYFDDVLILGLLFFLYNEDVKDESLFLTLILLLIS